MESDCNYIDVQKSQDLVEYFQSVFNECDKNRDGYVSIKELKEYLENIEEREIPEGVVEVLYSEFDKNKNRKIDLDEFMDMICNDTFKWTFQKTSNRILKFIAVPSKESRHTRLKLVRQNTLTGLYEEKMECHWNILGILILSIMQIMYFFANWTYKTESDIGPLNKALAFHPCYRRQIYRYVSYIFVHADHVHLFGNVVIQILVGIPLEMFHSWRCLVIYLVGAFGGSLAFSVCDRGSILVGGSGGVFALFTANIAATIMNWRERIHPMYHVLLFGIIVGGEVIIVGAGVIRSAIVQTVDENQVSYSTHLGGAAVGFLFGVNILRNIRVTKRETIFWYVCFATLLVLLMVFVILDICLPLPSTLHCNSSGNVVMKSDNIGTLLNSTRL